MASSFILSEKYLPLDAVRLGRLVTDKANPQDSYHDALPAAELKCDFKEDKAVSIDSGSHRNKGFRAKLLHYASLGFSKRSSFKSHVYTKCARVYRLDNSKEYSGKIIKLQETREWIETALKEGSQIYFLVGFRTFLDAVITVYDTRLQKGDLNLTMHVPGVVPEDILEVGVEGSVGSDVVVKQKYTADGEQVCALLYRRVKISQHKRRDLGITLKTSQWKVLDKTREAHTTDTDDVLEAEISESEERDNFEEEDDYEAEGWTKIEDEEGDFYL